MVLKGLHIHIYVYILFFFFFSINFDIPIYTYICIYVYIYIYIHVYLWSCIYPHINLLFTRPGGNTMEINAVLRKWIFTKLIVYLTGTASTKQITATCSEIPNKNPQRGCWKFVGSHERGVHMSGLELSLVDLWLAICGAISLYAHPREGPELIQNCRPSVASNPSQYSTKRWNIARTAKPPTLPSTSRTATKSLERRSLQPISARPYARSDWIKYEMLLVTIVYRVISLKSRSCQTTLQTFQMSNPFHPKVVLFTL